MSLDWKTIGGGLGAALAGALVAAVGMQAWQGHAGGGANGAFVRSYILDHPEIIPEAMDRLQKKRTAEQVASRRNAIVTPFPGAVGGNARGDVTLVEYFDYACGYCRQSVADVDRLVAADPNLRVVYKELPILSSWSDKAARMSLLAAQAGKFVAFHRALYGAGAPSEAKMEEVAHRFGLDDAAASAPAIGAEIDANMETARTLRMSGTPTFVIGDQMLSGAVGYQALKDAVDLAREGKS